MISHESDDGPDEDGFGREEYYDWWYLDELMNFVSKKSFISSCSIRGRDTGQYPERFRIAYAETEKAIRKRKIKW